MPMQKAPQKHLMLTTIVIHHLQTATVRNPTALPLLVAACWLPALESFRQHQSNQALAIRQHAKVNAKFVKVRKL